MEERYEDAFETLKTLYALTHEARDACNAGRTAFRLGRMVDAVEFLSVCEVMVREGGAKEFSVRDKGVIAGAMADLATAKQRVGRLVVTVNKSGAAIALDGKVIGASPLAREILVEPGLHSVRVTLGGTSKEVSGDVRAGRLWPIRVVFEDPPARPPRAWEDNRSRWASGEAAWRAPYLWVSVGLGVVGTGVATGALIWRVDAWDDMTRLHKYYAVNRCDKATGARARPCEAFLDATSAAETAGRIMGATIVATLVLSPAVFALGAWVNDPRGWLKKTRIQAAPTVGGVVIRGTF